MEPTQPPAVEHTVAVIEGLLPGAFDVLDSIHESLAGPRPRPEPTPPPIGLRARLAQVQLLLASLSADIQAIATHLRGEAPASPGTLGGTGGTGLGKQGPIVPRIPGRLP